MPEELADFLFEVASPERLVLLSRLSRGARSHTELARGLKRAGSETSRHLQRLTAAGLVTKDASRRYELTTTARVFNAGLDLFEFLVANRDYLRAHDLAGLEARFLSRLGELSKGVFTYGEYGTIAVQENALREARVRIWMITGDPIDPFLPILRGRAARGTDVRIACTGPPRDRARRMVDPLDPGFPMHVVAPPGLFLIVVDDRAGVCFPLGDGTVDTSTMITLQDPAGLRWAEDLFLERWTRAKATRSLMKPATPSAPRPA